MRAVRWLHISDLHMQEAENAQRQAVLSAMLDDIHSRSTRGKQPDFVVVSGDLAFSGRQSEYALVVEFLNDLSASIGLSPSMIFCVPGNHDVQRERGKMCFKGARMTLKSESDVYGFLADDGERDTLLSRQDDYRKFELAYFQNQERKYTQDKLAYVSVVEVEDLRIAIMGLNSSWLSEGGVNDEGKLLIGESQVKSAIDIAKGYSPHVVLDLQHHPFDLLQRFDRRPVQHRLEEACHFIHCGHLHDPEVKEVIVEGSRCITVTAGASFESRVSRNTYTSVELDPLAGKAGVKFIQYNPQISTYEYISKRSLTYAIDGPCDCTVAELADAIDSYCKVRKGVSGYLAALLLGLSSDVPATINDSVIFVNWDTIDGLGDSTLTNVVTKFKGVGRIVRLLYGRKTLSEILSAHGDSISLFVRWLESAAQTQPIVMSYITMQNKVRERPHTAGDSKPLRHTVKLLTELVDMDDWDGAQDLAERTIDVNEGVPNVSVNRILALCLARSTQQSDRSRAVKLYRDASESEQAEPSDYGGLALLLVELGKYEKAKVVIGDGMRRFPDQSQAFVEIGMKIVQATGDRSFRDQLTQQARGNQGE